MSNRLFSIIIPSYNGSQSLSIALQSIFEQTYKNIEVIVSDDNGEGTTAQIDTQRIIDSFSDKLNIIYLVNEHVNGSYARNKGLEKAKGEYISFLDDDDCYLPNYVESAIEAFNKNEDKDLVFFNVAFISREGVFRTVNNTSIESKELLFARKEIGSGSNICIRRKVYEETGGFNINYLRYQDIEFVVKRLNHYKAIWIDKLLIIKYFNVNENYLNYEKSLIMQKHLREDMYKRKIITLEEVNQLEKTQLHILYNDMVVKNMNKQDVKIIYDMLKERNLCSVTDRIVYYIYCISKKMFNFIYVSISNKKSDNNNDCLEELLKYRLFLENKTK